MTFKLEKGKKYIFATDLDGTFMHPMNHSLHNLSYEAVRKIQDAGHEFVIATGRSWWWVESIYKQLECTGASVHFSGAYVHHSQDPSFKIYKHSIPQEVIHTLVDKIDLWEFCEFTHSVGRKHHATWSKGDDLHNIFFNPYEYIIIFGKDKKDPEELVKQIHDVVGDEFNIRVWRGLAYSDSLIGLMISPANTDKSTGIRMIAEHHGIPQEQVIYFGDNVNDIDALEWAGHSYSPANGTPEAKEAADEVLELTDIQGGVQRKMIELVDGLNEDN